MSASLDLEALAHEVGPRFAEAADARDRDEIFVADNYDLLKARKVFSAMAPSELGGGGVPHNQMCAFLRALARYCGSTALALSMHQHLVAAAVFNYRNGKPGQKLLERVAAGEAVLVSTGANDWMASNGKAEKVDGGFRISARKPFASGSPKGDFLVSSAPYEDPEDGWQVLHFAAALADDGASLGGDWHTLGMRATGSETVILDRVFVPEDAVVLRRPRGTYHPAFNVILTVAMPLILSAYLGVAEAAAEIAFAQARRRGDDEAMPFLLGELTNELTTAQLAVDSMVAIANDWDFAPVPDTANAILVRKTIAAKAVLATAEKALETVGGAGFFRRLGLERLLRDLHGAQFHPLPEKRQHLFTGKLALGQDPIGVETVPKMALAAE
jgi:alkylation response protein AidB-like acyl-CoA dehydrogenase